MKTNYTKLIGIVLFALATTAFGETKQAEKIAISGTKFTYPLIEKWISEYAKVNPDVKIVLVQKSASTIDLNVVAHQPSKEELKDNQEIVYAGRYALLPVTNSSNPLFAIARKKGFTKNHQINWKKMEDAFPYLTFYQKRLFSNEDVNNSLKLKLRILHIRLVN